MYRDMLKYYLPAHIMPGKSCWRARLCFLWKQTMNPIFLYVDCKIAIFCVGQECEHSPNERSGTRVKTYSEAGRDSFSFISFASRLGIHICSNFENHAGAPRLARSDFRGEIKKNPDCFAFCYPLNNRTYCHMGPMKLEALKSFLAPSD